MIALTATTIRGSRAVRNSGRAVLLPHRKVFLRLQPLLLVIRGTHAPGMAYVPLALALLLWLGWTWRYQHLLVMAVTALRTTLVGFVNVRHADTLCRVRRAGMANRVVVLAAACWQQALQTCRSLCLDVFVLLATRGWIVDERRGRCYNCTAIVKLRWSRKLGSWQHRGFVARQMLL